MVVAESFALAAECARHIFKGWHPHQPSPLHFEPFFDRPHFHFDDQKPASSIFISSLQTLSPYEFNCLLTILERRDRNLVAVSHEPSHYLDHQFDSILHTADITPAPRKRHASKPVDFSATMFRGAPAAYAFVRWYCEKNNIAPLVQSARTFERHFSELIDNSGDSELHRGKTRIVSRASLIKYVRHFLPEKDDWIDK